MSLISTIRNWPDKKKRNFTIVTAIILTLLIVGVWYWFDSTYNAKDEPTYKPNPFASFSGMFQDIGNEFHTASNQLASTTAFVKAQLASSTATSTPASTSTSATSTVKAGKK